MRLAAYRTLFFRTIFGSYFVGLSTPTYNTLHAHRDFCFGDLGTGAGQGSVAQATQTERKRYEVEEA